MLSSARRGCLFSAGQAILLLLRISSWTLLVISCLRSLIWIFLGLLVGDLQEVARAKKSTVGRLDGWAWNEIKALPLPWFSGLAILLELVETSGVWPQGLLDAFFAMIPKADGYSTPLVNGPSVCSRLSDHGLFPSRHSQFLLFFFMSTCASHLHFSPSCAPVKHVGIGCKR